MRIDQFPIHSPIEKLSYRGYNNIFIKRDDLIDPMISGNKWRKLKYSLKEAIGQSKDTIVTFGGAHSNHLLATASACAKFNLKSIAFVRGEEIKDSISDVLFLCKMFGMHLIFVDRKEYLDKESLYNNHFKNNSDTYFIDEGGLSQQGMIGVAEMLDELNEAYDEIYLAAGTGCTTAGLLKGIYDRNLKCIVHSVVVHKHVNEIQSNLEKYSIPLTQLELHSTEEFGSYAQHSKELLEFCVDFTQSTGIIIDPIYTGKALFKMYEQGSLTSASKVLFIHTGGIFGNLGKKSAFNNLK